MSDKDDKVVHLDVYTNDSTPADKVLAAATEHGFKSVLVIGYLDNEEFYLASSEPDGGEALWLMERARHKMMQTADDLECGETDTGIDE